MTDRYCGFAVTLNNDMRDDDAEHIINAIRMIRGVVSVEPVNADPLNESILKSRIQNSLFTSIRKELFGR